eukprot:CAMPEP_0114547178 /NCGR_PEP_ID=MMETSP0114-20121206/4329_1 /TAXON_ID=31324 /ORGANISM="Goniomonas sp, Strain m" /LENGTH=37 /DNA_ID= /DNA_START= /DNA_END= /DNA_ORIENTATION=
MAFESFRPAKRDRVLYQALRVGERVDSHPRANTEEGH